MNVISVNLNELNILAENVRSHPRKQIEEYKRSLQMFGQTKNAVIDETNTILIGNGLVMAARELGWESIFAIVRPDLTPAEKKKIVMSDNKIFDMGVDNYKVIETYLNELGNDLDIPGYDEEMLKQMIASAEEVTQGINQFGLMDSNKAQDMNARRERAEAEAASLPAQAPVQSGLSPEQSPGQSPPHEAHLAEAVVHNSEFIICPHCNQKIWL